MAEGELQEAGGCDEGQSSEPMTEGSSGPVVGHDSNRVIDDSTNDKIGILSHEDSHAAGQPRQGDGVGQCLLESKIENPESKIEDVTTPPKAPNKANLESKQDTESQELKSFIPALWTAGVSMEYAEFALRASWSGAGATRASTR